MASLTELAARILARAEALENSSSKAATTNSSIRDPDYEETRLSLLDDVDSLKHRLRTPAENLFATSTAVRSVCLLFSVSLFTKSRRARKPHR